MKPTRTTTSLIATAVFAVASLLGGCTSEGGGDTPTPSAPETISAGKLAIASLLPVDSVAPAPPGDSLVDNSGPYMAKGVISEPSRQVITCTPREMTDIPGPAEPGAAAAASSGFVTGVAQVDQYVVVYTDEAAAKDAVARSRTWTQDCQTAFAVHAPRAQAEAVISDPPASVDGFRVLATFKDPDTGDTSDEVSAVLRSGRTVLYLRANVLGAPEGEEPPPDSILDPAWSDQLIEAAAAHLAA